MKYSASICLASLLIFVPEGAAEPASSVSALEYGPARGTLLIVGGGAMRGTRILEKFVELAGGPAAKIVVVPTAGGNRDESGKLVTYDPARVLTPWITGLHVSDVRMLHTADRKLADTEEFARSLRDATGVWFDGGRQWNLVDSYANTLTEREFHRVLERGGVIGGSSAGATIQGDYLVRGAVAGPQIMMTTEPEHQHGFAFLRHSAIDQHINTRLRWDDLIPVIKRYPALLGIGLSEDTAIIVTGDRFEVMGHAKVAIHDNTRSYRSDEKPYYLLAAGDVYNMKTRRVETYVDGRPALNQPSAATAADLLPPERKTIALDPTTLGRYVGAYKLRDGMVTTVSLDQGQLFMRWANQSKIAMFPESKEIFHPTGVDLELEFAKPDGSGRPMEIILHQGGRVVAATRLDQAQEKIAAEAMAAFAQRFAAQTAASGGAAALRLMAEDFAAGNSTSDSLSPDLAADARITLVRSSMANLGSPKSVDFKAVEASGADIYSVRFEHGVLETRIWIGVDGRIQLTTVRQMP